jgi:hypothetical protein
MNHSRIAQLFRQLANEFESEPIQPTQPPQTDPPPPTQGDMPIDGSGTQVAVMFGSSNLQFTPPVDVFLNGIRYPFSKFRTPQGHLDPIWSTTFSHGSTRTRCGTVVQVNGQLTSVGFDKNQIHFEGARRLGYYDFFFKVHCLPHNTDMSNIDLGNAWRGQPSILQIGDGNGSGMRGDTFCDPIFAVSKTFPNLEFGVPLRGTSRHDGSGNPCGVNPSASEWNQTGKILISIGIHTGEGQTPDERHPLLPWGGWQ